MYHNRPNLCRVHIIMSVINIIVSTLLLYIFVKKFLSKLLSHSRVVFRIKYLEYTLSTYSEYFLKIATYFIPTKNTFYV